MECKEKSLLIVSTGSRRINRNIVECKDGYFVFNEKTGMGINRNIVECKVTYKALFSDTISVLIETLWNVKSF